MDPGKYYKNIVKEFDDFSRRNMSRLENLYKSLSDEEIQYISFRKNKEVYVKHLRTDIIHYTSVDIYNQLTEDQIDRFLFDYFIISKEKNNWFHSILELFDAQDLFAGKSEILRNYVSSFKDQEDFYKHYIRSFLKWSEQIEYEDDVVNEVVETALEAKVSHTTYKNAFITILLYESASFDEWLEKELI